jgi:hypothetical protein
MPEEAIKGLAEPAPPDSDPHPCDLAVATELPSRRWLLEAAA